MNCCLCQKRLATDKRKRRKLHGPSCSSLKEELQKLSSVSLESLETLSDRDAYLCSTCEFQLKSIINLKGAVPPEPAVIKRFSRIPQNPPVTRSNLLSAN